MTDDYGCAGGVDEESGASRHVIVTAGSKEVMAAWQLTWQADSEEGPLHEWLGTRPPPKGGLRRRSTRKGWYLSLIVLLEKSNCSRPSLISTSRDAGLP